MRPGRLSYTVIEVVTVIVILAILAVLTIPLFRKTVEKSRERLAQTNLKLILAGENLYRLSYDHYYPVEGGAELDKINKFLNLDIEPKHFTYEVVKEGKYSFKIYAKDKSGKRVYSIDEEGNFTSLK